MLVFVIVQRLALPNYTNLDEGLAGVDDLALCFYEKKWSNRRSIDREDCAILVVINAW
jgi:hypothetical protein